MVDKTKRRRKRAADASGADSDKAQHVQALLRAGELTHEEVALAAHLRHKSAALVLGLDGRAPVHIQRWASEFARFGKRSLVTAGLAMAHKCQPLALQNRFDWSFNLSRIITSGEGWLRGDEVARSVLLECAQIETDMCDLTFIPTNGRMHMSLGVLLNFGHLVGEEVGTPIDGLTPLDLWNEHDADEGWLRFTRMVWLTAWIADNSGRGIGQYIQHEPCRAAVLHTIKFLRTRLLDQKWNQL